MSDNKGGDSGRLASYMEQVHLKFDGLDGFLQAVEHWHQRMSETHGALNEKSQLGALLSDMSNGLSLLADFDNHILPGSDTIEGLRLNAALAITTLHRQGGVNTEIKGAESKSVSDYAKEQAAVLRSVRSTEGTTRRMGPEDYGRGEIIDQ